VVLWKFVLGHFELPEKAFDRSADLDATGELGQLRVAVLLGDESLSL
jgi:hypothetical protein